LQADKKRRAFALAGVAGALALGGLFSGHDDGKGRRPSLPTVAGGDQPPAAPREFRAAWVSTVANIDWPSKPNLSAAQQQAEAIAILDRAKALNLNAIVLQVRPSADAIYPSKIEPWSEYLTGPGPGAAALVRPAEILGHPGPCARPRTARLVQSLPRAPRRRPVAVREQPHRAHQPSAVKTYGKFLWMDPGEEAASSRPSTWCWTWCAATTSTACTSTIISIRTRSKPPARPAPKARRWTARRPRPSSTSRTIRPGSATWPAAASWTAQTGGART
jgi:hypothetical protein